MEQKNVLASVGALDTPAGPARCAPRPFCRFCRRRSSDADQPSRVPRQRSFRWALAVLVLLSLSLSLSTPANTAQAATGINHQINFQGKLVNPNGTNVTDGSYTVIFSIYTVASGGSNIWTETQTVTVTSGVFQVNLGSVTTLPGSIDFNTDNIYLGIKVGADAEMIPRVQFTAVPQAFNSEKLGGLDKTGFIQNTTVQQAASNFNISGAGVVGTNLTAGTSLIAPLLQSAAATALTITGNAASTWSTSAGNITLQAGSGTISLGSTTTLSSSGALTITGGTTLALTSTGTNAISLDSGTTGAINIGTNANAKTITVGNTTGATAVNINAGTGNLNLSTNSASASIIAKTNTNSATAFQVQNATPIPVLNVDTINQTLTVRAGTDTATLGSELMTPPNNFATQWGTTTGWTTTTTTQATHQTGNTNTITNTTVAITSGATYQVGFTLGGACGTSATSLTATIGSQTLSGAAITGTNCSGVYSYVVTATGTNKLAFTPTSTWLGTISLVTIKLITGATNPALTVQNTSGVATLEVRSSGDTSNIFIGLSAGKNNTSSGTGNTALGSSSLQSNTTGNSNTALGSYSLKANTTGVENTALGSYTLQNNTTGNDNSALGSSSLAANTTGFSNAANGNFSLQSNTTGSENTATGFTALKFNTTGNDNTAIGTAALYSNTTGSSNTAIGAYAGYQDSGGLFVTGAALQNATTIGSWSQVQASNSIVLGSVDTLTDVGIGITVPSNLLSVSPLDYQTGTATRTNSSATLTGTSTVWTADMVGDLIVFADGTTNTVTVRASNTSITMGTTFGGTTDASPVAYRFHHAGLQVTSAGNIGIGTTNPSTRQLEVSVASGSANDVALEASTASITGTDYAIRALATGVGGTTHFGLYATASGATNNYAAVFDQGNVGIGNVAPGYPLDVTGSVNVQGSLYGSGKVIADTADAWLRLNQAGGFASGIWLGTSGLRAGAGGIYLGSAGADGQIALLPTGADNTRRITLDGGTGNITSVGLIQGNLYNAQGLTTGAASISGMGFYTSAAVRTGFIGDAASADTHIYILSDDGTVSIGASTLKNNLVVVGTGTTCTIGNGVAATNCTSDARLKNIVAPATDNLSKIMQLQPTLFTWKDPSKDQGVKLGLIAQNVQQQFPGFVITDSNGWLALDYAALVSPLIGAVQEQQGLINQLRSDVSTLQQASLANGGTISGSLAVTGNVSIGSDLNVSGTTALATLTVSGVANFGGDLTVVGNTSVVDIIVGGHVITAGNTPTPAIQAAAGANATVSIAGNDTSGTITITTGDPAQTSPVVAGPVAGELAQIMFAKTFGSAPQVAITASNAGSASLRIFRTSDTSYFSLNSIDTPLPNTIYIYDYFVRQ